MKAKYAAGSKVKIKPRDFISGVLNPEIRHYEEMTGEIVESICVVGFVGETRTNPNTPDEHVTVYHYTVKISEDVVLHNVLEDLLELSE